MLFWLDINNVVAVLFGIRIPKNNKRKNKGKALTGAGSGTLNNGNSTDTLGAKTTYLKENVIYYCDDMEDDRHNEKIMNKEANKSAGNSDNTGNNKNKSAFLKNTAEKTTLLDENKLILIQDITYL